MGQPYTWAPNKNIRNYRSNFPALEEVEVEPWKSSKVPRLEGIHGCPGDPEIQNNLGN